MTVVDFLFHRIVESSPTSLPQEGETDSAGETTEIKESADIMSPNRNSTVDVSGEREQLDAEGIEIISSILQEICTFLKQAKNLIVSGSFSCFPKVIVEESTLKLILCVLNQSISFTSASCSLKTEIQAGSASNTLISTK